MHEFRDNNYERHLSTGEVDDLFIVNFLKQEPLLDYDEQLAFDKDLTRTKQFNNAVIKASQAGEDSDIVKMYYQAFVNHATKYTEMRLNHARTENRRDINDYNSEKRAREAEINRHSDHINVYIDMSNLINVLRESNTSECDLLSHELSTNLHYYGLTDKISFPNPNTLQDNFASNKNNFFAVITKLSQLESTILQYPEAYPNQTDSDLQDFLSITGEIKNDLKDIGLDESDISSFKRSLMSLAVRVAYLEKHPNSK